MATNNTPPQNTGLKDTTLSDQMTALMLEECNAMVRHCLNSGLQLSSRLIQTLDRINRVPKLEDVDMEMLTKIYNQLVVVVAPAKPRTLLLLEKEKKDRTFFGRLGPVPIARHFMFVAAFSLIGLISLALSPMVNGDPYQFSLFKNFGPNLLVNVVFLLFSASLGASFFNLYTINHYIKSGTFDTMYNNSYWNRYILGLVAGMLIATMVPLETIDRDQGNGSLGGFGAPLLALVGGFSAEVVYQILQRLTLAFSTIIQGDPSQDAEAEATVKQMEMEQSKRASRAKLAARLNHLNEMLEAGKESHEIKKEIREIQAELIDADQTVLPPHSSEPASQP